MKTLESEENYTHIYIYNYLLVDYRMKSRKEKDQSKSGLGTQIGFLPNKRISLFLFMRMKKKWWLEILDSVSRLRERARLVPSNA